MTTVLAKLNKVDLRQAWKHEALDFTNWLSKQENLDLLGEEMEIEIRPIQLEAQVGKFRVDILAEEEGTGRKIVIENQMENTNHDHLGKIITYAAGYDAEIIIWIVKDFREEHRSAIDWLNEHTLEKIGFFLIKIELWQIEGSKPAPKFAIIASPNEWTKVGIVPTPTKLKQLDFWTKFKDFVLAKDRGIKLQKPLPQHWYNVTLGTVDALVSLTINSKENRIRCSLFIPKNRELFNFLKNKKDEIEGKIGEAQWYAAPVESSIRITREVTDIFAPNHEQNYFSWLYEKTVLFRNVFGKHLKEFKEQPSQV
jgi:hypothetical protein